MSSHLSSHGLAIGARLPMPDSIHGNDDPLMAAFNPMGDSPEPSPHEPTESSYIDPATLPEGWTPCEMSGGSLGPTLVYASPEGWRATTHGPTVPWVTEIVEPWRIVRTLEPAEDLPVIACEDMKPGMMVESRQRLGVADDRSPRRFEWEGPLEYHLVSAPDPEEATAELLKAVMRLIAEWEGVEDEGSAVFARDLIALVREAGGTND